MIEKFKFQFSTMLKVLIYVILAITIAYVALSIYSLATSVFFSWVSLIIPIVMTAILVTIFVTLIKSCYSLDKDKLTVKFCIVKYEIKLKNILSVKRYKTTNKLAILHGENEQVKLLFIQIIDAEFDKFVKTMREFNSSILYDDVC